MARKLSAVEFEELGRKYYKQGNYEKAADAFTEGVEVSINPSLSLLDCRCAVYEKLEKFNMALRDGKRMIELDRKSVKVSWANYLRKQTVTKM
jgi:F-box/TPR repeat protein Pof3